MDAGNEHESSSDESQLDAPWRYPGDDTRPTSSKELAGWYMYAFAAETFVICGTGYFSYILFSLPLLPLRFVLVR